MENLLDLLEDKNIISFELNEDRKSVLVEERCDMFYSVVLNKQQMLQLADELKSLADTMLD